MKVICIDVDGTAMEFPEKVRELYENENYFILLFTARSEAIREETVRQLREKDIPYHALEMGKPRADVFIDDRNSGGLQWKVET